MQSNDYQIAIIGLGYVGLPLAVEFGKSRSTIGFDINQRRIEELMQGQDITQEVDDNELASAEHLRLTHHAKDLAEANFFIVTVPTPIDNFNAPDLGAVKAATKTVGQVLSRGAVVVFESTVYPGVTEEICVPILESESGLTFNQDFFVGYSPERINPGDKEHRLPTILKITSGSTPEAAELIDSIYRQIITAGTYQASSIRVAEAAKVIENTQRDINIALINELALIFDRLGIDTLEVLEAAGTKWNFLPFRPGLVGGHCIGVDPFYLTHKAQEVGYHPEVILAGRRINDGMGAFVAEKTIKLMAKKRIHVVDSRVLVLGLTFKENCPDIRNTRVIDVIDELKTYHINVDVYDPWVNAKEAHEEYQLELVNQPQPNTYDAVIVAVAHDAFKELGAEGISGLCKASHVIFDVKHALPKSVVDGRL